MADSSDSWTNQHDISELDENEEVMDNHGDPLTPEDKADNDIEGADVTEDTDKLRKEAYGDEDDKVTIGDAINRDEIAYQKGIKPSKQQKKKKAPQI